MKTFAQKVKQEALSILSHKASFSKNQYSFTYTLGDLMVIDEINDEIVFEKNTLGVHYKDVAIEVSLALLSYRKKQY